MESRILCCIVLHIFLFFAFLLRFLTYILHLENKCFYVSIKTKIFALEMSFCAKKRKMRRMLVLLFFKVYLDGFF